MAIRTVQLYDTVSCLQSSDIFRLENEKNTLQSGQRATLTFEARPPCAYLATLEHKLQISVPVLRSESLWFQFRFVLYSLGLMTCKFKRGVSSEMFISNHYTHDQASQNMETVAGRRCCWYLQHSCPNGPVARHVGARFLQSIVGTFTAPVGNATPSANHSLLFLVG
jgi:hypothetical protein